MKKLTKALLLGLVVAVSCIYLLEIASAPIDVPASDDIPQAGTSGTPEELQIGRSSDRSAALPEIRIELATRVSLGVEVIDTDGQPVSGTTLDLLRSNDGEPVTNSTRALDHRNYSQLTYYPQNKAIRLDRAKTDTLGLATLRWRPSPTPLSIRLVGPNHITMVRNGIVLGKDSARVRITVQVGARLAGQLRPLDVVKQLIQSSSNSKWRGLGPRIILTQQGKSKISKGLIKTVAVSPDGTFEFKGLAPGAAELRFTATRLFKKRGTKIADKLLGTIDLARGSPKKVNFDISDLRPADLAGVVIVNGAESRQTDIHLTRIDGSTEQHRSTDLLLQTDDNGRFHSGPIGPGRYALAVDLPSTNRRRSRLTCPTIAELPPGADITQAFQIMTGSLQIRVRNADGSAAANRDFWIIGETTQQAVLEQSDAQGRFRIEQLSAGEYIVRTRPSASRVRSIKLRELTEVGRLTVTGGNNPTTIELKLPAK